MKNNKIIISIITIMLFFSCELNNFDLQDNPNQLTQDAASPDYLINEIQLLFAESMSSFDRETSKIMRYTSMNYTYADMAEPAALNSVWEKVYALRENAKIVNNLAQENETLRFHNGMAKVLNAYAFATMVDYLGDIPYSEANNASNLNPVTDDDASIYDSLLADIDSAIADFNASSFTPKLDLFFNGDKDKWIKLAKSLKFKMLLNMSDNDGVSSLIDEDDLITNESDDFQFQYSSIDSPVDSRHPMFIESYSSDGPSTYMGNYFMWLLKDSKDVSDPRLRYYIYRQINVDPQDMTNGNFIRCLENPIFDYCYVGDYYWGRDHGDDDSRPNDGTLKAVYGLYPAGGTFDADNAVPAYESDNLGGSGILPILTSFHINFLKAEAVLTLNANGDAKTFLENGIRNSINKVLNFAEVDVTFAATPTDIDTYVNLVLTEFDAAASNELKLDIVMRELYLATYGNTVESYNAYRRTGYPSNIQVPIKSEAIPFPRTFSLPKDAVDTNTSLNQRPITTQVFWDTKPAGFIK